MEFQYYYLNKYFKVEFEITSILSKRICGKSILDKKFKLI